MLQTVLLIAITIIAFLTLAAVTWRYYGGGSSERLVDVQADMPVPFGTEVSWLAVPTDDISKFCNALSEADDRLERSTFRPCNWESGLARARADVGGHEIFVTPPVDGWIFASNWVPPEQDGAKVGLVLDRMSEVFGRATAFQSTDNETMWALAKNGRLRRGVVRHADGWTEVGSKTPAEASVGIDPMHPSTTKRLFKLAAKWSKDPSKLDQHSASGVGRLGSFRLVA